MPVKILLADKSITIQKVVEMLFSGKEYEVLCVSDGETALAEAERSVPDVVLADIDLPRIDGYSFAARIRQLPALGQTPVILMMSRDDVFDANKARQGSIVDHIAKPFESQDLIGKVKKAVSAATPRVAEPTPPPPPPAAAKPQPSRAAAPSVPAALPKPAAKPKQAPPSDIFDIIQEAPSQAELKRPVAQPVEEEMYEVEPVVEVEEPTSREMERALPVGEKAVEEMRAGLGLQGKARQPQADIVSFESLDMATAEAEEYRPKPAAPRREEPRAPLPPMREAREYVPPPPEPEDAGPVAGISEERLRSIVEDTAARIVREVAREVIEKVAWEVIPELAEMLIKAEIERLKQET